MSKRFLVRVGVEAVKEASSLTYASLKRREFSLRRVRVLSPDHGKPTQALSERSHGERDKEEEGGTTGRASLRNDINRAT